MTGVRFRNDLSLPQYYSANAFHVLGFDRCCADSVQFMALLLLRHALGMIAAGDDDDESPAIFTVFLLKAIGFILPCYIMARAISVAQRRRQQQASFACFRCLFPFCSLRPIDFECQSPFSGQTTIIRSKTILDLAI